MMKTKSIFAILFITAMFFFISSCNNEEVINPQGETMEDSEEYLELVENKEKYLKFIEQLQAEFPEMEIYHNYNRPDYFKEIDELVANSVEDFEDIELTRAVDYSVPFGPWGGKGGNEFNAKMNISSNESWKK